MTRLRFSLWLGRTPHGAHSRFIPYHQVMKTHARKKALTFGNFITRVYDACGARKAKGIVRHAVNAGLLQFRGQRYIVTP